MIKRLGKSIIELLLPRQCAGCGQALALDEEMVCVECLKSLPWDTNHDWKFNPRMVLADQHPCVDRIGALMRYRRDNIAANIVRNLKFHHQYELGPWMGRLAVQQLQQTGLFDGVQVLVPIPLTRRRQRSRGFNQAEWIANGMAEELGLEVKTDMLRRRFDRESQTHFSYEERMENVRDVFNCTEHAEELARKHVMLVDDVMTTGATMAYAVAALEHIEGLRISVFAWAWLPHPPTTTAS